MKTLRIRLTPDLDAALEHLKTEDHANVSAWTRAALRAYLEKKRPDLLKARPVAAAPTPPAPRAPEPDPPPAPVPPASPRPPAPLKHWETSGLGDGTWGALWRGDTTRLPVELVGCRIEVKTKAGDRHVTTILEVVQREDDFVKVRDAGW